MLHGEIKVNEVEIGRWTAVNTAERTEAGLVIYRVTIDYRNLMGYPMVAAFEVEHDAGYGALTLAGKILTEAPAHLKQKPVDVDDAVRVMSRFI